MLRNGAIANVLYGVGGGAADMKAICVGIGDEVILTTVTGADTYLFNSGTGSITAGRALTWYAPVCPHINAGGGGGGGGASGGVKNGVAKL